jgi:hypothetical protein
MSAAMKKAVSAQSAPLPPVIPGLSEATAQVAELDQRYHEMRGRLAEARSEVAALVAARDALQDRAKSGEVVPGVLVADAEAAIRTAESNAALLEETAAGVLGQVEAAEAQAMRLAFQPIAQAREAAQKRLDAARAAAEAAQIERAAAFQEWESVKLCTVEGMGQHQLGIHAPEVLDRRAARDALLEQDRKKAADQARIASEWSHRQARQAELARLKAENRARGWPEDFGLSGWRG